MAFFPSKTPFFASYAMATLILILIVPIKSIHSYHNFDPYQGLGDEDFGQCGSYCDECNQCPSCQPPFPPPDSLYKNDILLLQFAQNLEHLECDFFLSSALGYGLDVVAPQLTQGGPPPIGAQKANLDDFIRSIITEFAYEEIGHLRALKRTVGGIPRPLIDISAENFARVVDEAFGCKLEPPFNPYRDSLSYMLGVFILPYLGLNGYVDANPQLRGYEAKRLLAGLLGVEAGQNAVVRMYLYERANEKVCPYDFTVAEFTTRISILRNKLGMRGIKDEGVVVPSELGAEGQTCTNVLSANRDSLSYPRTPAEILRILYRTGDERVPDGFFPKGANGKIARGYLDGYFPKGAREYRNKEQCLRSPNCLLI